MSDFKTLKAWSISLEVAKNIYHVTKGFPPDERYGLTAQMRRAAVSIMSNIAEGCRRSAKERLYFITIAQGSASELEAQVILAKEIGFISEDAAQRLEDQIDHAARIISLYKSSVS